MNTNNKLKEYIKEESQSLPKEVQEVLNNSNWEKIVIEIGKKYKFTEDEILTLKTETVLILTGIVDSESYTQNIRNNVAISEEEAEKIAEEVDKKIFKPIFDLLTKNIKNTLKIRNIHWRQNLDFILSGGDYTAFIRRVEPVEGRKLKVESIPSKVDDLKSKFTI